MPVADPSTLPPETPRPTQSPGAAGPSGGVLELAGGANGRPCDNCAVGARVHPLVRVEVPRQRDVHPVLKQQWLESRQLPAPWLVCPEFRLVRRQERPVQREDDPVDRGISPRRGKVGVKPCVLRRARGV
eukprot:CAMPEP_0182932022 /NCGR_PEP_ID=MMETSP0105_2-20130417/30166_1 /TAXON_ID=81532 ORGANISM="Acanthoeca-like sp., Strain 10tr" /NCGR_SAMPLE_ID=MMETSP0105_2 /ASSEMBLY_ACC=CAM_ASM_000205 /LENGTH=129 /DNA_ID=CAMNT_0025070567 /DNA_START=37 /DNA_END=424 /DNA_ORIENTATION=-